MSEDLFADMSVGINTYLRSRAEVIGIPPDEVSDWADPIYMEVVGLLVELTRHGGLFDDD